MDDLPVILPMCPEVLMISPGSMLAEAMMYLFLFPPATMAMFAVLFGSYLISEKINKQKQIVNHVYVM